jgi:hypothetical protein
METDVSKPIAVNTLIGIVIAVVLLVSVLAFVAARSYMDCASRLLSGASPSDLLPPTMYRRLSTKLWHHRDLYLARVLAQECAAGDRGGTRRFDRELLAAGVVKTMISPSQRETLGAIFGHRSPDGGRGLTRAALAEWGRPPAELKELEMTWLFVVAQAPGCSKQRVTAKADPDVCASLYQSLLDELRE